MKKREIALNKFLKKWLNRKYVIGAVACGSYITGNPSPHSDIDVHIIFDDKIKRKERGNVVIDNFLIEYFANPLNKYYEYMKSDFDDRKKINAHMFFTGKIIFDKNSEIAKLKNVAKKYLNKKFKKLSKSEIELNKYRIWDLMDNLEEIYEKGTKDFHFVFYTTLYSIFDYYSAYLQRENVNVHKIYDFLTNGIAQKKYLVKNFPDKNFVKLFLEIY